VDWLGRVEVGRADGQTEQTEMGVEVGPDVVDLYHELDHNKAEGQPEMGMEVGGGGGSDREREATVGGSACWPLESV
jgi:hypothetical protein